MDRYNYHLKYHIDGDDVEDGHDIDDDGEDEDDDDEDEDNSHNDDDCEFCGAGIDANRKDGDSDDGNEGNEPLVPFPHFGNLIHIPFSSALIYKLNVAITTEVLEVFGNFWIAIS